MLDELRRVAMNEVPKNKRWDPTGVWEEEFNRVSEALGVAANLNFGKFGRKDDALSAGKGLPEVIVARFGSDATAVDPDVMHQAALGRYAKQAPSLKLILAFSILKWTAMGCETLLFVFLALMGFANYIVVIVGLLLALSGYLMGHGVGNLLVSHEAGGGARSPKGWLYFSVGLLATVGLSVLRASGSEEGIMAAILIPIILAATIALFEALSFVHTLRYKNMWEEMFRAQVWYSIEQHQRRYREGLWRKVYEGEVERAASRLQGALSDDPKLAGGAA